MQYSQIIIVSIVALVAVVSLIAMPSSLTGLQNQIPSKITGAVTYDSANIITITASDQKGTLKLKNEDGQIVSIPFAADGSATAGTAVNEPVLLGTDATAGPDKLLYLEGETCTGTSGITDCLKAQFLVISSEDAHIFEIDRLNTEKNEIDIEDKTYGKESNNNIYTDGGATAIQVGDIAITLTITESSNTITFTSTGSSSGADIKLYDKSILEIINTNLASQSFDGIRFSEYNDGSLSAEKYIGQGGTSALNIEIVYDDFYDNTIEISDSLLTDLTTSHGSGWYSSDLDKSFYTNKGTLFTYDGDKKHKLAIGAVISTVTAQITIKPTSKPEATGWTMYGVDTQGDVGKDSSLVLDSNNYAHISYFDETNDILKYAYETEEGWYVTMIDKDNTGRSSDIAVDSNQYPHIIYTDNANKKLKYGFFNGQKWLTATIEEAGKYAILPSLALDKFDSPHIVFYDYVEDDLVYIWFNRENWEKETVDSEGDVGTDASIVLDSNNYPHISYFDNTYDFLKYAWYDGLSWNIKELSTTGTAGLYSSISLDSNDYPTVWYYNKLQDKVISLQYLGNNLWDQQTFSLEGFQIYRGDIVLDKNGYTHFSYYWEEDKDLRYAFGVFE